MEQSLTHIGWRDFLNLAASVMTGDSEARQGTVGDVVLLEHQRDVIGRIEFAMRKFGGALLADDVGLGKTFVALAIASRQARRPLIVAPASLRQMWLTAARKARVRAPVLSLESFGRKGAVLPECDFLVVDEAHHLRNPHTARYRRIAELARHAGVILLSATPVHNRESDLSAMLAIFMGSKASALDARDLAAAVIRRESSQLAADVHIPPVVHAAPPVLESQEHILDAIMALPPPLPPSGAGDGGALILFTLVRQWASSFAAFSRALRRRLVMGCAMQAALENGVFPSTRDLQGWCASDEVIQLPLFGLFQNNGGTKPVEGQPDMAALAAALQAHMQGLKRLLALVIDGGPQSDDSRWHQILRIVRMHSGEKVVAFSQFAETARAMFRRSLPLGHSALLTSAGAAIASGPLPRQELISLFAPNASGVRTTAEHTRVDLLFSTDLLSEGANLQDASVLVHLDLPWTPVRLTQRVGRLARAGSSASQVTVYTFPPPASAESLLRMERRLAAKLSVAARSVGVSGTVLPLLHLENPATTSVPQLDSRLRLVLANMKDGRLTSLPEDQIAIASIALGGNAAFLALVEHGGAYRIVCGGREGVDEDLSSVVAALERLQSAHRNASVRTLPAGEGEVNGALLLLRRWCAAKGASSAAGLTAAATARARRRILKRIDAISLRAPAHIRPRLHQAAARARRVAGAVYGHGAEQVLAELASASMPDESWLRAVECFVEVQRRRVGAGTGSNHDDGDTDDQRIPRLIAILILR